MEDFNEKDFVEAIKEVPKGFSMLKNGSEYAAILGSLYPLVEKGEVSITSSQLRPQVNARLDEPISHGELGDCMNFLFDERLDESVIKVEGDKSSYQETVYTVEDYLCIIGAARELRGEKEKFDRYMNLQEADEEEYMGLEGLEGREGAGAEYTSIEDRYM